MEKEESFREVKRLVQVCIAKLVFEVLKRVGLGRLGLV